MAQKATPKGLKNRLPYPNRIADAQNPIPEAQNRLREDLNQLLDAQGLIFRFKVDILNCTFEVSQSTHRSS